MDLYLRKVAHPQARDNYRVVWKDDVFEIEIGSIGIQYHAGVEARWVWGIDTVVPMRAIETEGQGKDRTDCMKRFKAAWTRYAADPARLSEFMRMKRQRLPKGFKPDEG